MIRLSKSVVGKNEIDAVRSVLERGFLGMGTEVQKFELELAEYLGGGVTVVCVNTGTAALHLALQAVGVGPGDEVLVPSLTYLASFQAVSATGAVPVACDVHEDTALLDLSDAEKRVTPRTKAIMPVHYASSMGDLDAIYGFARRHGLRVVEDAAHAFACSYRGRRIGSFGDVVCFSFDGIKNITSGEGGAIVTSDPSVIAKVQDGRLLAVEKDTQKRFSGQRSWEFDVVEQGWRYHMSDIMAAIGRAQLSRFESDFKPKRIRLAALYRAGLEGIRGVRAFQLGEGEIVPHIFPIRVLEGKREKVRQALLAEEIQVGIHYKPNHLLTKYRRDGVALPASERLYEQMLTLPLHPDLEESQLAQILEIIRRETMSP